MRKLWLSAALIMSMLAPQAHATAAIDSANKVVVVDIRAVLQKLAATKGVDKQLESDFDPRREKILKAQNELKTKADQLSKDAPVLSEADKQKRADQLEQDRKNLARLQQDFQEDLNQAQNRLLQNLSKDVQGIITAVAQQGGYQIVLPRGDVPYVDEKLDITPMVLASMDKKH